MAVARLITKITIHMTKFRHIINHKARAGKGQYSQKLNQAHESYEQFAFFAPALCYVILYLSYDQRAGRLPNSMAPHNMHRMKIRSLLHTCLLVLLIAPLNGCGTARIDARRDLAQDIAGQGALQRRVIQANGFDLTTFSKITQAGEAATIYIEGDGLAWRSRREPSNDPTPTNPVALHLAQADMSANVIYLARPCQYTRGDACAKTYWTHKRFAPEVIETMNAALDTIVSAHHIRGVRLVGFSGGGAVAALLAARRTDVIDLRTVAGNLDIDAHSRLHDISPLSGSLNPVREAARLRDIPQHHFISMDDNIVPARVYQSYAQALGATPCLHHSVINGAAHEKGWDKKWAQLQGISPACTAPIER